MENFSSLISISIMDNRLFLAFRNFDISSLLERQEGVYVGVS